LNPGGGSFGPDGRYYVGLRSTRTVMALSTDLEAPGEPAVAPGIVPFSARICLRSGRQAGIGPDGQGDNTIVAFARGERDAPSRLVNDPELSPTCGFCISSRRTRAGVHVAQTARLKLRRFSKSCLNPTDKCRHPRSFINTN
jgi:hypothetical protein